MWVEPPWRDECPYNRAPWEPPRPHRVRTQQGGTLCEPGGRVSPDPGPDATWILDLQPPELNTVSTVYGPPERTSTAGNADRHPRSSLVN